MESTISKCIQCLGVLQTTRSPQDLVTTPFQSFPLIHRNCLSRSSQSLRPTLATLIPSLGTPLIHRFSLLVVTMDRSKFGVSDQETFFFIHLSPRFVFLISSISLRHFVPPSPSSLPFYPQDRRLLSLGRKENGRRKEKDLHSVWFSVWL